MGFKNGKIIKHEGFQPLDLNEGNVQAIFNRCLAKEGEATTYAQILQKALAGKDSDLIEFSKERIIANSKNISYLLGQLKGVHERARLIPRIRNYKIRRRKMDHKCRHTF